MRDVPSSISLASLPRMARDPDGINPDGVNLQEDYSQQLEPSGSRHVKEQPTPAIIVDDSREEAEPITVLEMKELIGVPPPPPPGKPPHVRRKKSISASSTDNSGLEQTSLPKDTNEEDIRDDCDAEPINNNTETMDAILASTPKASGSAQEGLKSQKNASEIDIIVSNEQQGEENVETTVGSDTCESPLRKNQEELDVTGGSSNAKVTTQDQKRTKKRRFFKKLFRGGKNLPHSIPESKQMISASTDKADDIVRNSTGTDGLEVAEASSDINDKSIRIEQSINSNFQEPESIVQVFSIDPPDNDSGDPPESLGRPLLSPAGGIQPGNAMNKDPVGSKEPVGTSPATQENTRMNQLLSGDPQGATPKARACRISSNDPIGVSYTHESKVQAIALTFDSLELEEPPKLNSQIFESPEKVSPESPEIVSLDGDQSGSQPVPVSVNEVPAEKIKIDIEKSGFKSASTKKPLSVSTAAFTNAKAMAYLHQLDGEPSPRNAWHSNNSIAPPLSEKSIALAKIRAFSSKRKKGKVETATKFTGPSPDDYSATNSQIEALIKEKNYVQYDPSKSFAPYSRFKGRLPRKENETELELSASDMVMMPVQGMIQLAFGIDLESIVPGGKLRDLALARGAELRQLKREGESKPKPLARVAATSSQKSFNFFPARESTIKNPIQRAGRRLLSKAAIPIQAGFRMYLSRTEATDKMWALIQIQSYFRRWKCEAVLHEHKYSVTMVQKIVRGHKSREELKIRNKSATSIQKIARGYLAALRAYETIYFVTRAQAVARGFLVRTSNARKAKELKDVIIVQSVARRRMAITSADLIRKSVYSAFIIKFQALWRGYAERSSLQRSAVEDSAAMKIQASWRGFQVYSEFIFALVDILVVQRKVRQWLAVRKINKLRQKRNTIILVQSIARRFLVKKEVEVRRKNYERNKLIKHEHNLAATSIQKCWRGFWGYSHFVIVRYETTRIQALIRGKLERNRFNLTVGCTILIQAAARRFLVRKAAASRVVDKAVFESRVIELRERNSAIHIQFWWRIVVDWMKEKKAALVIERFFMFVKSEVDRELCKLERERIMKKKNRKKVKKGPKLDKEWMDTEGAFSPLPVVKKPPALKKNARSGSAPVPRPSQKQLVVKDTKNYKSFQTRDDYGFLEMDDMDAPPAMLHLAPSADFSMVSNITNPQFVKGNGRPNSEEAYQEVKARSKIEKPRRLTTDDYIKKYNGLKTAPNKSLSESQSQHFFSDERSSGTREKKRQSFDVASTLHRQRQSKVSTPREGHYDIIGSQSYEGFEVIGKPPAAPRSSPTGNRVGSTPRNGSTRRNGPTPRNSSTPRKSLTPRNQRPPVTPTRKKAAAISRSATAVTECSTPVEGEKMYIPPRPKNSPRKTQIRIMKTSPNFMDDQTFEETHDMLLLGDDYGEV